MGKQQQAKDLAARINQFRKKAGLTEEEMLPEDIEVLHDFQAKLRRLEDEIPILEGVCVFAIVILVVL